MRPSNWHAPVAAVGEVTDAGALEVDHARAQIRQLARRERRGDGVFEGDDGESLERLHGSAFQGRDGVHRQPAFVVLGPQLDGVAFASGAGPPQAG